MRLGFDLNLEQSQKLIMTPELRQAIQMLQFTSQELVQYVEGEVQANPLLEVETKEIKTENIYDFEKKSNDVDWKEYLGKYDDISYSSNIYNDRNDKAGFESYISTKTTLRDHLLFQLNITFSKLQEKEIGEMIIESIDRNGYLDTTLEELSLEAGVCQEKIEDVLKVIQTFDPIGVGSRNLKECLLTQLKAKNKLTKDIEIIVNDHLEDVAKNRISNISKELGVSKAKAQKICDLIKTLEPKPGRGFFNDDQDVKFITPDLTLEYVDGEYIVLLNDSTVPKLNINKYYRKLLKKSKEENISEYLNEKLNSAMWIIRSIEQRRMTIYNVAKSIVKFQRDFFDKGSKYLKTLTLKDVAEDINVHESTVSRATNGKFIQTPRGLFELKYFFSSGVTSQDGGISSTSIKTIIKELIEKEDPKKPLSDQRIANLLNERNIEISRRTVAKYRDELKIPSSSGRRRY